MTKHNNINEINTFIEALSEAETEVSITSNDCSKDREFAEMKAKLEAFNISGDKLVKNFLKENTRYAVDNNLDEEYFNLVGSLSEEICSYWKNKKGLLEHS